jgi:hypothetical protein
MHLQNNVVSKASNACLVRVAQCLTAKLESDILRGARGTDTHLSMICLACACTSELDRRAALLPVDVSHEDGIRFAVRVRVY